MRERQELLDALAARLFQHLDRRYAEVVGGYCPNAEVARDMLALRRDFTYAAWELLSMEVGDADATPVVRFQEDYSARGADRTVRASLVVTAKTYGRYTRATVQDWNELVGSIVEPLARKVEKSARAAAFVPKRTVWAVLNKMTGDEPMIELQRRLDSVLRTAREEAERDGRLAARLAAFKESKRDDFLKKLRSFLSREANPFTEEEDLVRTWREVLARSLMED